MLKKKKVYKIREVSTGKYLAPGSSYNNKSTWLVFPKSAIAAASRHRSPHEIVVDVFELVKVETRDINNNKIQ